MNCHKHKFKQSLNMYYLNLPTKYACIIYTRTRARARATFCKALGKTYLTNNHSYIQPAIGHRFN